MKWYNFLGFVCAFCGVHFIHSNAFEADDSVHYRIDWKPYSQMPEALRSLTANAKSVNSAVFISGADDNKYICEVPNAVRESKKETTAYTGPSPGQLIEPLYKERICSYWLDVYWTYELCHGRYILQFHEDKEANRRARTEYYLGNYARDQANLEEKNFSEHSPPLRKVDDRDLAYFPVTYKHGTVCDLTGKPRTTVVMYVCKEGGKDGIYAFAETSSCNYEMIVLTERLCAHPAFRPAVTPEYEISCYPRNPHNGSVKPLSLVKMEENDATAYEREYSLMPSETVDSIASSKSIPKNQKNFGHEKDESLERTVVDAGSEEEDDDDVGIKEIYPATSKTHATKPEISKKTEGPGRDPETILRENKNLLSGRDCLYGGGSGWWKYEFCYGKNVLQYHEDQRNGRVEILLGRFSEEIQRIWIEQNPQKRPLKVAGEVQEVYHVYSGGDLCQEENFRRSVEVRIRCRHSKGSQTSVSLYLTEPSKCQYVLRVESPRFCDILQQVDQYGLVNIPGLDHLSAQGGQGTVKTTKAPT